MKRLAVIADIHGNSVALQAVLADIRAQRKIDHFLILGDLAVFGPDPYGVIALLRDVYPAFHVCGNTDRYLVEKKYPTGSGSQSWQSQVLASFPWTAEQLGQSGLQFLSRLPTQHLLSFSPKHTVLAVHGSARNDEDNIRPSTTETELAPMLGNMAYNLMLCAHTHVPFDRTVAGRRVVNVGSVGLPFDGDPRASYGLIDLLPNGEYHVDIRRVSYDIEAAVDLLFAAKHPATEITAYNLRTARPLSQDLIYTEQMRRRTVSASTQPHLISPVESQSAYAVA